ncbi:HYR domain-containing protein, partial [Aequorivita flava]
MRKITLVLSVMLLCIAGVVTAQTISNSESRPTNVNLPLNFQTTVQESLLQMRQDSSIGTTSALVPPGSIVLDYMQFGSGVELSPLLTSIGFTVTEDNGAGNLDVLLPSQPWDLVILQIQASNLSPNEVTALSNYLASGGKLIMSYWNLNNDPAVQSIVEVSNTISFNTPISVSVWDAAHPIFNNPNTVSGLATIGDYGGGDNGDRLEPAAGATALGGFVSSPTTNEAAIVLGNGGNSIFHGFAARDMDLNSYLDLIENEVEFLVKPNTPPTISCPGDITVDNDANECGAIVTYTVTANDAEDGPLTPTQTAGLPSGSQFPVGTTTNTFEVTDSDGNTETCSFDVTVEDNEAPTAVCLGSAPIFVGSYRVSDGPTWNTNPSVYSPQEAAALIFGGNASDYAISVDPNTTDPSTITNTGWTDSWGTGFVINAEDYSLDTGAPGYNNPGGYDSAVSAYVRDHTDLSKINYVWTATAPTVIQLDVNGQAILDPATIDGGSTDNCGIASMSVSPNNFTCADVGPNTVTLTVTDVNGNSSTCTSTVIVEDNVSPTAVCQPFIAQLDATGNVTITGADVDGGSTDACGISSLSVSPNMFTCADIGPNNVTLTVTDVNGNVSTCTTIVTVEDNEAPVITCVANDSRNTDPGVCTYTVVGTEFDATFTDNCTGGTITNDYNGTATLAGEIFPSGTTTVVWTANDGNGQTATCSTDITVVDNQSPVITCVPNQTRDTDPGVCDYTVVGAEFDATFNDNCGGTIGNNYNGSTSLAGAVFPIGSTTVVWAVFDGTNPVVFCQTVITIEDNEAPVITCVPNATRDTDAGVCSYTVVGTEFDATFTDNCTSSTLTNDYNGTATMAGEVLPKGVTTVIWTVDDGNGQTATCTTVITVEDNEDPVITCVPNATRDTDPGLCNYTVVGTEFDATFTD